MLPAMWHASPALAPIVWRIATKTRLGESIQKGFGLGKGQVQQEGVQVKQEGAQVKQEGAQVQKTVAIPKKNVVRLMKSRQVQKQWHEVQFFCLFVVRMLAGPFYKQFFWQNDLQSILEHK